MAKADTSDDSFQSFAGEALRLDPSGQFGPTLDGWRRKCGMRVPLRDSLYRIFDEERQRASEARKAENIFGSDQESVPSIEPSPSGLASAPPDLALRDPPEGWASNGPRSQTVDLNDLRSGFGGRRYAELVEHHLRKAGKQQLLTAGVATMGLLPEAARNMCEQIADDWNSRGYNALFWQRDCAEVFDEIVADMGARLSAQGFEADDDVFFNLFQVVRLNFAYSASDQRNIRKFMGIRKGLFG